MAEAVTGNIRFTIGGVPHVVDISSIKAVVQFERHFDTSAQVLSMSPRMEYIAFMAWTAAGNAGIEVPEEFDDFLDAVDEIEVVDDEDGRDVLPTDGGQSAEL